MRLGRQTITRRRAGSSTGEDDYGNPVPGAPDELVIRGCSVQPGAGAEFVDRREAVTTLYTVWAPVAADVIETDTILFEGVEYAVDGQVAKWAGGTRLDHKVIRLKAVS